MTSSLALETRGKKIFFVNIFPKGNAAAFGTSLWTAPKANFFPKSFSYTLVMWRALKSGYGHFPRGREGYRDHLEKKKFFGKFFPKGENLDSTEDKFFFQSLSFIA